MANAPTTVALSEVNWLGRVGFIVFKETWPDGNVKFYHEVGRPVKNKKTGEWYIIKKVYEGAEDEARAAIVEAKRQVKAARIAHESMVKPAATTPENTTPTLEIVAKSVVA